MTKCSVHGTTLVNKETPDFHGYSAPEVTEVKTHSGKADQE
jgi:hypothetical protein